MEGKTKVSDDGRVTECHESERHCINDCPYRQDNCTLYKSNPLGLLLCAVISVLLVFIGYFGFHSFY